jgi:uncharacterized protein (DUF433 family)
MDTEPPPPHAQALLRVLTDAIKGGEIQAGHPETFLSYSEALRRLGQPSPLTYAGRRLERKWLEPLNVWTIRHSALPKVTSLIVDKKNHLPAGRFFESHRWSFDKPGWRDWWLDEANRSIQFDWSPFLQTAEANDAGSKVREPEETYGVSLPYSNIITSEPGKHGGRPTIRGMRITVGDILGWLATGMDEGAIISDHPELTREDIRAALAYAAERENQPVSGLPRGLSKLAQKWAGRFTLPEPDLSDPRLAFLLERYAEKS